MDSPTLEEAFWFCVNKNGPVPEYRPELGPCWIWTKKKLGKYGSFSSDGRLTVAHRVSYEWANGPVPKELELDHLCRVTLCVNPAHLEAVTYRENVLRGMRTRHGQPKRIYRAGIKSSILQARVLALAAGGASGRQIAATLKIDRGTVYRILGSEAAQQFAAAILRDASLPGSFSPESTATPEPKAPEPSPSPTPSSIRDVFNRKA